MSIKVFFKIDDKVTEASANIGDTLLEVAHKNGVKLFGGCGGAGVCGTCHIIIDKNYIGKINTATGEELDVLDILSNGTVNSRLACQIIVSEAMDGITLTIPS